MRPVTPTRRRQTNTQKQTVTYAILLIILVIFLATVGLQIVIKTSLFFAGFSSKKTVKNLEDSTVLIEPEIDNLPDATSSARIIVEGRAAEKTVIEIYVNEDKEEELEAPDGTFSTEVTLKPGENTLYVRSLDEKKVKSKDSEVYKVVFINKGPELTITNPSDGSEVDKEEVTVSGTVTENTTVKVNGLPTTTNTTGQFNRSVQLIEGDNTIAVVATDLAGNTVEKQLKIRYRKD
jgi:bacillopeptidase F